MRSTLSAVPVDRRRRLAATLGLFAALFTAVGAVATTGGRPGVVLVFAAVAFFVALLLALAAWGVAHSIRLDLDAQRLGEAIDEVMAGAGQSCGCGHEHDPSEMHVRGGCDHDGAGVDCARDCATCELAALRPSPAPRHAAG